MKNILKKMSGMLLLTAAFVVMLALSRAGIIPTASAETAEPVQVGIPLPLTGDLKAFGIMMQNSFELAAEKINRDGGINGRSLKLVYADDKGENTAAKQAVDVLSTSGVVMLVGGYASDPTFVMAKRADKRDLPFLICTASADKITQVGLRNVYRLNPPISEYTKGLEDFFVKDLKPRSMGHRVRGQHVRHQRGHQHDGLLPRKHAVEIRTLISYPRGKRPADAHAKTPGTLDGGSSRCRLHGILPRGRHRPGKRNQKAQNSVDAAAAGRADLPRKRLSKRPETRPTT